jgi:autotransporter-associated beta strand protein
LTTIALSPSSATLTAGQTQQFTGTCKDQFGNTLQPALTWSVLAGSGSISGGLYSPAYANGSATVQAASGGVTATAGVTISGEAQWNSAAGGSWTNSGDWVDSSSQSIIAAPGVRGIAGDTALFASTTASTITLDGASPILAGITFNSGSEGYTIGPGTGGALHLANGGNSASIAVSGGSQAISAPLALDSSVLVNPVAGSALGISGPISGPGSSLTLNGPGRLVLSGANSYNGGTTILAGTLILVSSSALQAGSSLTVGAGGILRFDPSATLASPVDAPSAGPADLVPAAAPLSTPSVVAAGVPAAATLPAASATKNARLLHRNALGQVSRFVDVAAAGNGDIVSQELQRNDRDDWLQKLLDSGHLDHVVRQAADLAIAFTNDGNHRAATGFDFFDI